MFASHQASKLFKKKNKHILKMTFGGEVETSHTFLIFFNKLLEMKPEKYWLPLPTWDDFLGSSVMIAFESPVFEACLGNM